MDVQLQELVDKIRKDGVETAEASASEIIRNAEAKALAIVNAARAESESIVKKGTEEAKRAEAASISAIKQAGRNLILSFRDGIVAELDAIVKTETVKAYNADMLKELIPTAVKSWVASTGEDDVRVLLSESDAAKLESGLKAALKAEIEKGLTIGAGRNVSGGFRIGTKDGSAYYDFSAQAVADLFSAYLNPRVADILKSAAKEL